jgi:hypothetical protein
VQCFSKRHFLSSESQRKETIFLFIIIVVNSINYIFMIGSVAVMILLEVLYQQTPGMAEKIPLPISIYI